MNSLTFTIHRIKQSPRFKKWLAIIIKVICILILVAILIRILVFAWVLIVEHYGTTVTNDIDEFISGEYVKHPDGNVAAEYLPRYDELTDYEWIDYYYFDASLARKLLGAYGDSFVVDVKYSKDIYQNKKKEVFSYYFDYDEVAYTEALLHDIPTETNRHVVIRTESELSYFLYGKVMNGFYIEYNDSLCIIRYCFVHRIGYLNVLDIEYAHDYFQD